MLATAKIDIEALLKTDLPPLPGAAMRVAALTQDFNATTRSIAEAIGADPVLSARVLKAANSPLYALERRVTALPGAVQALGNETIHLLVVVSAASDVFSRKTWRSPLGSAVWRHSLAVGLAARHVFEALGLSGKEEAFVCGLLHDIGRMVLAGHEGIPYAGVLDSAQEGSLLEREYEVYGYTHAQVGALCAKRWGLPDEVSYAIYHHHDPGQSQHSVVLARAVDVADALANAKGVGLRAVAAEALGAMESVIALRLAPEQLEAVWEKVGPELEEMEKAFS
jgi:putative nucleotidyltransferase with HDIG domain